MARIRQILTSAGVALIVLSGNPAVAQDRISRAQLETMFSNMRTGTSWDVDGPLLWGYFFTGTRDKLGSVGQALTCSGYRQVEMRQLGPELWLLHMERAERHTVASLSERNDAFYALAASNDLASYDGMDVGPIVATTD